MEHVETQIDANSNFSNPRFRFQFPRRRGFTLVEMMVVLTVIAILVAMAIPSYTRALEQSQANIAAANLRAIWAAEQWWWLENGTYTANLQTDLANTTNGNNLIDPQIATATHYRILLTWSLTDSNHFTRLRHPDGKHAGWSGSFTIDQTGNVLRGTRNYPAAGQTGIVPGFQ